jgi:hypothetical protein
MFPRDTLTTIRQTQVRAVAVGEDAVDEQENNERRGLRGNHEAKVACGSRQVEHRPDERKRRDSIAEPRHQLSREEQAKLALLKRAERDPPHLRLPGVQQPMRVHRHAHRK